MRSPNLLLCALCALSLEGWSQSPMAIPPLLEQDTFQLTVGQYVHQFYPGVNTTTFGVNGPYLGPTLLMHRGDTARLKVINELPQVTSMHWHGMHVPGDMDGGPQREVQPGADWDVKFQVDNPAGTYWYHPHPHMLTASQATKGIAGMIIVRDAEEEALDLPRAYGVDDFPVVIQDRRFLANGSMPTAPYGDSVLVNGTPHAYLECPAQVVRLRLLNGANARVFDLGFENGTEMHVITGDGGLLNAPVTTERLRLSNGERYEVLLDLSGLEGDSLLLMSFGSELPQTVPGSNNLVWESSALNGIDFPVLRIRVTAPTPEPVTVLPTTLSAAAPWEEALSVRTRTKILTGNGMVGMGMFMINGQMFDIDVINDTMQLGSVEIWNISNNSNMAHPMHIHGVSFFVLDRNGVPPPLWEQGAKDVVLVDAGETVRLIMRFGHPTAGWPYMYHCHNLLHEDNMMMLQFIVEEMTVGTPEQLAAAPISFHPNPTAGIVVFQSTDPLKEVTLHDMSGRLLIRIDLLGSTQGSLDLDHLPPGPYLARITGKGSSTVRIIMRE
jgi:blue copper oxidase